MLARIWYLSRVITYLEPCAGWLVNYSPIETHFDNLSVICQGHFICFSSNSWCINQAPKNFQVFHTILFGFFYHWFHITIIFCSIGWTYVRCGSTKIYSSIIQGVRRNILLHGIKILSFIFQKWRGESRTWDYILPTDIF